MSERKSSRRKKFDQPTNTNENSSNLAQVAPKPIDEKRTAYSAESTSISWDVIHAKRKVTQTLKSDTITAYELVQDDPEGAIKTLKEFSEEYNDVHFFNGLLLACYAIEEEKEKLIQLGEELFKKFPDYVFGKLGHIESLLAKGEIDSVEDFLGEKKTYQELFPGRAAFHIAEILQYHFTMGRYFALRADVKTAETYLEKIKDIDEDNMFLKKLRKFIDKNSGLKFYQRVIKKFKSS
ncbi:MAG: hypothetical protein SFU98_08630 [Leptospiraceae bacterium]|nr:hypothetical protein [Leptospiraceae bacterium]